MYSNDFDPEFNIDEVNSRKAVVKIPDFYGTHRDRWAIIVGISQYQDETQNLKYAHRDAEELYKLLLTPTGGGFEQDKIIKLIDEEATTANITKALRSFLKKPAKEDIVLLYFACHGSPDIDRPDILYLITHDTKIEDISGTALPMREINLCIQENLLSERIVIIADTCHSAGINKKVSVRETQNSSGAINLYLQEASTTKKGLAILTSAEANQVSFEDEKWGGGHGVFTHYLLEGMKGAADNNPRNGIVTIGELFEYIRDKVKKETNNQQHPCVGTDEYDRNLPMAITADISAEEHYQLGCELYKIGKQLNEKHCLESASRHFQYAIRLAKSVKNLIPEAYLKNGLALMALQDFPRAINSFQKAQEYKVDDASYYLGIIYLKQNIEEKAKEVLKLFLVQQPSDHKVYWVKQLLSLATSSNQANRYALLIGTNNSNGKCGLSGCANDIEILSKTLSEKYNFEIIKLVEEQATYKNIINKFNFFKESININDFVFIHFSGAYIDDFLLPFDGQLSEKEENNNTNLISLKNFDKMIQDIPTPNKLLSLDTGFYTEKFQQLIDFHNKAKQYSIAISCSPGESASEIKFDNKQYGVFSYFLAKRLEESTFETTQGDLLYKVGSDIKNHSEVKQEPLLIGDLDKKIFDSRLDFSWILDPVFFENYFDLDSKTLKEKHQLLKNRIDILKISYLPYDFHERVGKLFLRNNFYFEAIKKFQLALELNQNDITKFKLNLKIGESQILANLYNEAINSFQKYIKNRVDSHELSMLKTIVDEIKILNNSKKYALLVGIKDYSSENIKPVEGAVNDILAVKDILINQYGFEEEAIITLQNKDATRENILSQFKELINKSYESPALFYFAGYGSLNVNNNLTVVAADSRKENIFDIELNELQEIIGNNDTNLISIFDAGWTSNFSNYNNWKNARNLKKDNRKIPLKRKLIPLDQNIVTETRNSTESNLQLGSLSIYTYTIKYNSIGENYSYPQSIERNFQTDKLSSEKKQGLLTHNLVSVLRKLDPQKITIADLFQSLREINAVVIFKNSNCKIFENVVKKKKILKLIHNIENKSTELAIKIIQRQLEQRSGFDSESYLNLGICYYFLGQIEQSIEALENCLNRTSKDSKKKSQQEDINVDNPIAHYWLGRVLYERKKDTNLAVYELRLAIKIDPDNSFAQYYLGQALRALVEQEILSEAEKAFQNYLQLGSPLGREEEIQSFLNHRKDSKFR